MSDSQHPPVNEGKEVCARFRDQGECTFWKEQGRCHFAHPAEMRRVETDQAKEKTNEQANEQTIEQANEQEKETEKEREKQPKEQTTPKAITPKRLSSPLSLARTMERSTLSIDRERKDSDKQRAEDADEDDDNRKLTTSEKEEMEKIMRGVKGRNPSSKRMTLAERARINMIGNRSNTVATPEALVEKAKQRMDNKQ
eukprot:g48555.t1